MGDAVQTSSRGHSDPVINGGHRRRPHASPINDVRLMLVDCDGWVEDTPPDALWSQTQTLVICITHIVIGNTGNTATAPSGPRPGTTPWNHAPATAVRDRAAGTSPHVYALGPLLGDCPWDRVPVTAPLTTPRDRPSNRGNIIMKLGCIRLEGCSY